MVSLNPICDLSVICTCLMLNYLSASYLAQFVYAIVVMNKAHCDYQLFIVFLT